MTKENLMEKNKPEPTEEVIDEKKPGKLIKNPDGNYTQIPPKD